MTKKKQRIYKLKDKGLSYREIGKIVGVSGQYIHQVITGYKSPFQSRRYKYKYKKFIDALIWCSGSDDFAIDGKARKGWEKIVQPLIKTLNQS
jgi:hypothetical protein